MFNINKGIFYMPNAGSGTRYITTDIELISVAEAIRQKGNTNSDLIYPNGFIAAIENIETGTDVSDTTTVAENVLSGTYFYTALGVKTEGAMNTYSGSYDEL